MTTKNKLNTKQISKLLKGKTLNQTVKLICGEKVGSGAYRDVYVLKQNPNYVVKIERDPSTFKFANVTEWLNYINNKDYKWLEQWLAPCEMISATGRVLIQQRVTHGKRKDYPKHVPRVFTDLKLENFGWINDRFVCCDYSFLSYHFAEIGMKTAKWWGSLKDL